MQFEFTQTDHRPFPMPDQPWIMTQVWNDLLFAHWPVDPGKLIGLIPSGLTLDLYKANAWISIIPFRITGMRGRGMPAIPGFSSYNELNVRTYVIHDGIPGIYFFSLDANHLPAVLAARAGTGLPYKQAEMTHKWEGDHFLSACKRMSCKGPAAEFKAAWRPKGNKLVNAEPETLEYWLLERYAMFVRRGQKIMKGEIHHDPWTFMPAEADITENTFTGFLQGGLAEEPVLLHYSPRRRFFFFPPEMVGKC